MSNPYDKIHHDFIFNLRAGHDAEIAATLAFWTRGHNRQYHLEKALEAADKVTAAAAAIRAEMERIKAAARAREMNAELPADQRDVMALKGMVE